MVLHSFIEKPLILDESSGISDICNKAIKLEMFTGTFLDHYRRVNFVAAVRAKFNILAHAENRTFLNVTSELHTRALKCVTQYSENKFETV